MDLSLDELKIIANKKRLDIVMIEKDYLLTHLLYLINDIDNIYFKGGTALNKIFLNHERLSEDLDFTVTDDLIKIENEIKSRLKGTIFSKITYDKKVDKFVRLVIHYKLFHEKGTIFMDLNQRARVYLKPEEYEVKHFYSDLPKFNVKTLNIKELIAEKISALIQRYAPRDYYDIYNIIKKGLPIDIKLVKRKFKDYKVDYDIDRIFRRGNKVYSKWDSDLLPLTSTKPDFKEVMKVLVEFFKYRSKK